MVSAFRRKPAEARRHIPLFLERGFWMEATLWRWQRP